MSGLPKFLTGDRISDAVALPLLSIGQAIFLGVGVFATREAFTALHVGEALASWTLFKLIVSGVGMSGLEVLRRACAERLGQSYAGSLRIVLYRHLAGMRKRELDARRLGSLSLRFVGDLTAARNWYGWGLPRVIAAAIVLPGAAIVLWLLEPRIALVSYIVMGASILLMGGAAIGFELLHRRLRSRRASIAIAMMERIAIAPLLDLMGRTQQELAALEEKGKRLRSDATARAWRAGALSAIPQIGLAVTGAVALWHAARLETTPGTVAALLSMLGVLALPLRDVSVSWDHFNGWRIARSKALNLLSQHSRLRSPAVALQPVGVEATGKLDGEDVALSIAAGSIGRLRGGDARRLSALAMLIAGLDERSEMRIGYGTGASELPRIHFIGDSPIALQGSLRRTMTLGISPRPKGEAILKMAQVFGLAHLLPQGRRSLKERVAEAARNLTTADSLRIDLVRIALANPDLVVIDTVRFAADPEHGRLLRFLSEKTDSTIIVVDHEETADVPFHFQRLHDAIRTGNSINPTNS
ncbi:ABC transporter transmembrane domain-containing protein [Roseovarius aestuarii]|uniref:Putative multidrug export ATP-binding/permease protein n=1 Tax=Roseovarius aestuarii TaxID=475083 RepID=A0A1X7BPD6_9RHOB|nr:ABC transporter transmembrane domain-containing protein [Roseovarius aestuarii]SMC11492.1 Putative multidrug export ATP-binding/permease protein [Roseovarius aestuarii]